MTAGRNLQSPVGTDAAGASTPAVVVMGVSGCGKSVVGSKLAETIGARFVEGDVLHPPENVARMASGQALTDELRAGWLDRVGAEIAAFRAQGLPVVAACSALKRSYRDRLRRLNPGLAFLHLELDPETARQRVQGRKGHFMPSSLVDSQFAALERPTADEFAVQLDALRPVDELVAEASAFMNGMRHGVGTGT